MLPPFSYDNAVVVGGGRDRLLRKGGVKLLICIGQLSFLAFQLRELCKENALAKGQIAALEETINVHEMEAKASRETIMRLVSEVNREQKKAASCAEDKDKLNQVPCVRCACASVIAFIQQKLKLGAGEHTCFTAHGLGGCS